MTPEISATLSAFVATTPAAAIPASVIHDGKRAILNNFAAGFGGCRDAAIDAMLAERCTEHLQRVADAGRVIFVQARVDMRCARHVGNTVPHCDTRHFKRSRHIRCAVVYARQHMAVQIDHEGQPLSRGSRDSFTSLTLLDTNHCAVVHFPPVWVGL